MGITKERQSGEVRGSTVLTHYDRDYLRKLHAVQRCTTEMAASILAKQLYSNEDDIANALKAWKALHPEAT